MAKFRPSLKFGMHHILFSVLIIFLLYVLYTRFYSVEGFAAKKAKALKKQQVNKIKGKAKAKVGKKK